MELLRRIREFFNNFIQERWKNYTTSQKILIIGSVLSVLIVLIALLSIGLKTNYVILVKNLSEREAGVIIQKLEDMGIPYKAESGGTILVPDSVNVYSVRMKLATEGVLGSISRGFEILDTQPFGSTSFDKQVRYQVALQGELERTISSLEAIKTARVHLTIPKYTYYVRGDSSKPKASV
ncbi:MAG: flagellar M-ring protein FliF, partial [Thermotogaceae bacterium]|nr:flagellar M-ring protein FliF [Thermotogaceae bacterium]